MHAQQLSCCVHARARGGARAAYIFIFPTMQQLGYHKFPLVYLAPQNPETPRKHY
jgi:hypothetical protein